MIEFILGLFESEQFWSSLTAFIIGLILLMFGWIRERRRRRSELRKKSVAIQRLIAEEVRLNFTRMLEAASRRAWIPYFRLRTKTKDAVWAELVSIASPDHYDTLMSIDRSYSSYDLISRELDILYFAQGHGIDAPIYVRSILPQLLKEIPITVKLLERLGEKDISDWQAILSRKASAISLPLEPYHELSKALILAQDQFEQHNKCLQCFARFVISQIVKQIGIPDHAYSIAKSKGVEEEEDHDIQKHITMKLQSDGQLHFTFGIGVSTHKAGAWPLTWLHYDIAIGIEKESFVIRTLNDHRLSILSAGDS